MSSRILGHRGAPHLALENTVAAFQAAISAGADGVELDVQVAGDGTLVLHHDTVVGDEKTPVWRLAYAELCERVGHRLSTLAEALAALPREALIFVEFKRQGSVVEAEAHRAVAAAVRARPGWASHRANTIIGSFDPWYLHAVASIAPDVSLGLIVSPEQLGASGAFDPSPWAGLRWVSMDRALLATDLPERVAAMGLSTLVWSVDDPVELSAALSRVDGVITKQPARAVAVRG
jgi:glycerophosphoryl diester phosphodiesterase